MIAIRDRWIDIVRGLSILTVIYYHTGTDNIVIKWFTSFHMFIFFFLSGYCFNIEKYISNTFQYYNKKFKSLIIPYIFFSLIYSIINFLVIHKTIKQCLLNLFYSYYSAVWFLSALFLCLIISNLIITKYINNQSIVFLCFCMLFIFGIYSIRLDFYNIFRIKQAIIATIFYFFGYYLKSRYKFIIAGSFLFGIILLILGMGTAVINDNVIFSRLVFGNIILMLLSSFSSILGIIICINWLAKTKYSNLYFMSIIEILGRYSMVVLCTHQMAIYIINIIICHIIKDQCLETIAVTILVAILELLFIKLLPKKFFYVFGM